MNYLSFQSIPFQWRPWHVSNSIPFLICWHLFLLFLHPSNLKPQKPKKQKPKKQQPQQQQLYQWSKPIWNSTRPKSENKKYNTKTTKPVHTQSWDWSSLHPLPFTNHSGDFTVDSKLCSLCSFSGGEFYCSFVYSSQPPFRMVLRLLGWRSSCSSINRIFIYIYVFIWSIVEYIFWMMNGTKYWYVMYEYGYGIISLTILCMLLCMLDDTFYFVVDFTQGEKKKTGIVTK